MICEFSEPVEISSGTTTGIAFSKMECADEHLELIENASTGASFYIDKTFSYGDILLVVFLTLFLLYALLSAIFKFFWPE